MEIDIANNIKAVELLKIEVLQNVTDLFGDIAAEADSETYLRCDRLGVGFDEIEEEMREMLREGAAARHILERRFGALSGLLASLEDRKDRNGKYEG